MLNVEKKMKVRFNEVDSYNIVWNGSYAAYFEAGRQEFGETYQIGFREMLEEGYLVPLTKLEIEFKRPLRHNEEFLLDISYVETKLAKIIFNYRIVSLLDGKLACTGKTEQVFLNKDFVLQALPPRYILQWRELHADAIRGNRIIQTSKLPH